MTRLLFTITLAVAALTFVGCGAQTATQQPVQPAAQQLAPPLGGPAVRTIEFPGSVGEGQPREAAVLVDEPALKLVTIVLRAGTVLPEHHADVPVTILALQGAGTLVAGSERLVLDATHAVVLAPNVTHAVEPEPGTDLVLLVHHLGQGEEHP